MLDKKLESYAKSDIYPFHMPGHKRQMQMSEDPYRIDITEIDGFDDLHRAEGVLLDAQQRAADLYGSQKAYYLVNGSTCGLLAAISAAVDRGAQVLVARGCHKAVYHAMYLRELHPHYLYPEITAEGIVCAVTPDAVGKALQQFPQVQAVILTSPTYDGIVSDIAKIAEIVHRNGIPLIVDEAHGAHLGIARGAHPFPESAVTCGADLVVQSLHKTLPSFTQTALLHICSSRVPEHRVEQLLDIYETSSPSYVLMAGMERCIRMMAEDGERLLVEFRGRLDRFREDMRKLVALRLLTQEDFSGEKAYAFDASKVLVYTGDTDITGKQLYDRLLQEYGLQMEMAAGNYVLAMTSIMDTEEGFARLAQALLAIDADIAAETEEQSAVGARSGRTVGQFSAIYSPQEQVCTIAEAVDGPQESLLFDEAEGRIAADYLYLYPPGIPLIAPGERITERAIRDIHTCLRTGLTVYGLSQEMRIQVVKIS